MSIDSLYGSGAFTKLLQAVDQSRAGTVTQSDSPDGSVHVEVAWSDTGDLLRMDCYQTTVHFSYLSTTCAADITKREPTASTYQKLCQYLATSLKTVGVLTLTAAKRDDSSTSVLEQYGGFVDDPANPSMLVWVL
jgi:hypothetical protein